MLSRSATASARLVGLVREPTIGTPMIAVQGGNHGRADRRLAHQSDQPGAGGRRAAQHHGVRLRSPGQHERLYPPAAHRRVNSPGGYVYVLYGEDTFGRDEAVQTLKERMRALPAGEHNLTELGPETTIAALRLAADVVPFLAERRMVLVRGLLGRLSGRGGSGRRPARGRKSAAAEAAGPDEFQLLLDYLPDLPQTTSLVLVEDGRLNPEP